MKISYNENGQTKTIELKQGESWSKFKNSKALNSLFAKVDNGNGKIDATEIDALVREMHVINYDGNAKNISQVEQDKLKALNWQSIRNKVQVAENIYNDVNETNWGMPTTGKNIRSHVFAINTNNATTVCKTFSEKTNGKETIIGAILTEYGLDFSERAEYIKHIVSTLAKDYKSQGKNVDDTAQKIYVELEKQGKKFGPATSTEIDKLFTEMLDAKKGRTSLTASSEDTNQNYDTRVNGLNGEIDKDFSQGKVGDCWLLASIKALSMNPKGLQILNDSVTIQKDGNVRVHLKGVDGTYIFSPSEILGRTDLSTGDLDIRAIEMAVEKYLKTNPMRGENTLASNKGWVAYYLLTGKGHKNILSDSYGRYPDIWISDRQIRNFNKPNHIACVSRNYGSDVSREFRDKNGNTQSLVANHSYAVVNSDKRYVYLVNPWDSSEILSVSIPVFKSFFNSLDELDL